MPKKEPRIKGNLKKNAPSNCTAMVHHPWGKHRRGWRTRAPIRASRDQALLPGIFKAESPVHCLTESKPLPRHILMTPHDCTGSQWHAYEQHEHDPEATQVGSWGHWCLNLTRGCPPHFSPWAERLQGPPPPSHFSLSPGHCVSSPTSGTWLLLFPLLQPLILQHPPLAIQGSDSVSTFWPWFQFTCFHPQSPSHFT